MNFDYRSFPNQIHFGNGKISILPDLLKKYKKAMIFAEQRMNQYVNDLTAALGQDRIIQFSNIIQHVPEYLVQEAHDKLSVFKPDVLVSIGGGSSIGLAKVLALETKLPIIAVPTTFAGSEQTNIWGITTQDGKTTGRSDWVLPRVVIYDPDLTITMPLHLAVTSAMNAMAHLMEAIYSPGGNPITRYNALLGMKELKKGLDGVAKSKSLTREANEKILFGAYLAGKTLCEVSMSLHHKVAHVLGGSFGMEHASVHTVLQPYVLAYQWPHLSELMQQDFINVLENDYPPKALRALASEAGANTDLESIGFNRSDIEEAARIIVSKPYENIRPITEVGIIEMLTNAYEGKLT